MNDLFDASASAARRPATPGTPFWIEGAGHGACPVCASAGPHDLLSDRVLPDARLALAGASGTALAYFRCASCGTVHAPGGASLRYEDEAGGERALRYYLEEGAGIDLLIDPLARIDRSAVRRYAEIGCSFGFSLDVARRHFGWDVRGIDPSPLAAAGRDALGLPIEQRYLGEHRPLSDPPADLLQAAEVIEHVTDPHAFMRALLASLDERGVLVVSTPNAALLRDGTPDTMLLQVLQPGMHLTLLTASGLVTLAEAHGLRHHHVHETPEDVTLYASRHPFAFHAAASCDRALYLDYLRRRLPLAPPDTPLRRGLMSRLLRELTLQGRFDEMDPLVADILAEYRGRGLDLDDPGSLAPSPDAPFNVATLLYCLGMREVMGRGDRRRGIACFDAAVAWHARALAPLSIGGVEDASAAAVAGIAAFQAASARIALDPEGEHDRRVAAPDRDTPPPLSAPHRAMLFAELVNRGDMGRAAVHHARVAEAAAAWGEQAPDVATPGEETGRVSVRHRATTCFVLGIFALNHGGDRRAARRWLGLSADTASLDGACEDIRYAAVIALHRAADPADQPAGPRRAGRRARRPGAAAPPGPGRPPAVPRRRDRPAWRRPAWRRPTWRRPTWGRPAWGRPAWGRPAADPLRGPQRNAGPRVAAAARPARPGPRGADARAARLVARRRGGPAEVHPRFGHRPVHRPARRARQPRRLGVAGALHAGAGAERGRPVPALDADARTPDRRADAAAPGAERLGQHGARLAPGRLPEPAVRQQLVRRRVDRARSDRPPRRGRSSTCRGRIAGRCCAARRCAGS